MVIGPDTFRTQFTKHVTGGGGGKSPGDLHFDWPYGSPLWILDTAVSTRDRALALGRRAIVVSHSMNRPTIVMASTRGDAGMKGQILSADPATRKVHIRVPWGWQRERQTTTTYEKAAPFTLDGKPATAEEALVEDYWITSVRTREQIVSVLSESVATRAPAAADGRLLAGEVKDITDIRRNRVVLSVKEAGKAADAEIGFSRVNPFVLDCSLTTAETLLTVGRRVICIGGTGPSWIIGVSDRPGDITGTVTSVDADGGRFVVAVTAEGESSSTTVELGDDTVYMLDHKTSSLAGAVKVGRAVTVRRRRAPHVDVRTEGTDWDH